MKLSVPVSRQSTRWIKYLDPLIADKFKEDSGAYIIDIEEVNVMGPNTQALLNRAIQEATVKFGAELL